MRLFFETKPLGIRKDLTTGKAPFEEALKKAMESRKIEAALEPKEDSRPTTQPTKATKGTEKGAAKRDADGKSKSQRKKENLIQRVSKAKDSEIEELKKKIAKGCGKAPKGGKGDSKGGKGKGGKLAEALRNGKHQATSGDGRKICFGYNLPGGCTAAEPGKQCPKGWHICTVKGCKASHSATTCDKAN